MIGQKSDWMMELASGKKPSKASGGGERPLHGEASSGQVTALVLVPLTHGG